MKEIMFSICGKKINCENNNVILKNLKRLIFKGRLPQSLISQIYDDETIYAQVSPKRKHLWVIAAPKSGSTWMSAILRNLLPWDVQPLAVRPRRREHEPDIRNLVRKTCRGNLLSPSQHVNYSEETVKIIEKAHINCVFLYRNIFDQIVSAYDHSAKPDEGLHGCTAFLTREIYNQLDHKQKWGIIIDLGVPWYLRQYVGWFHYLQNEKSDRIFPCAYEDLREEPVKQIMSIMAWAGIDVSVEEVEAAVGQSMGDSTRKNKAISGRARQILQPDQVAQIVRMANYYPDIDLSAIGINEEIRENPMAFFEHDQGEEK
jgi:hypothetical protein